MNERYLPIGFHCERACMHMGSMNSLTIGWNLIKFGRFIVYSLMKVYM